MTINRTALSLAPSTVALIEDNGEGQPLITLFRRDSEGMTECLIVEAEDLDDLRAFARAIDLACDGAEDLAPPEPPGRQL